MITPQYYWENTNSSLKVFFEKKNATIALKLLQNSKKDPLSFGIIVDYISTEYYYENSFSWSDWTPSLWDILYEQSHYFLQQPPIDSSVCSNASHK